MATEQGSLHGVTITRGAKGEKRWEVEATGMSPDGAVERALQMDRMLTKAFYPEELVEQTEEM